MIGDLINKFKQWLNISILPSTKKKYKVKLQILHSARKQDDTSKTYDYC